MTRTPKPMFVGPITRHDEAGTKRYLFTVLQEAGPIVMHYPSLREARKARKVYGLCTNVHKVGSNHLLQAIQGLLTPGTNNVSQPTPRTIRGTTQGQPQETHT